jgi:alpha-glucosidase
MISVTTRPDGFDLHLDGRHLIAHSHERPFLTLGSGDPAVDMYRGNFDIADRVRWRRPQTEATVSATTGGWRIAFEGATLTVAGDAIAFEVSDPEVNRVWLQLVAEPGEHVWGGGEQMSYFDLRGRRFPLWTSEPGVGRDKSTWITQQADATGRAGGDYYTTNYPQPTFFSSRRYAAHVDTTAYAVFDFTAADRHEIEIWAIPTRLAFFAAHTFEMLTLAVSHRLGRARPLPDWVLGGAIIGLKQGERSFERLARIRDAGVEVSALWCEDWAGVRQTSFGTRLFWDWRWNPSRYPDLPRRIAELGVRFMGYCSPYLCADGTLFPEAEAAGVLARTQAGGTYLVDFGEFECGVIDFTHPGGGAWWERRILRENMLGIGMSGWMADFGEYLPTDVVLANGDPMRLHNAWPALWAEVNARAVAGTDAVFFMRAGYTGSQRHCPLLWAGDQCVDFSRHDGLRTVICGALSSGLMGNAAHHSDVGGYTSLFGLVRTAELLMRWAEMAAFTPVMRTHEGNRPADNLQIDSDPAILAHFARMTRIHVALVPYVRSVLDETGLPAQRPLFLHFDDPATYTIQDASLYGRDLLVAPVHQPGADTWTTYLPGGAAWVHLWSGRRFTGGQTVTVPAPIGSPPVFWREGSAFAGLFQTLPSH